MSDTLLFSPFFHMLNGPIYRLTTIRRNLIRARLLCIVGITLTKNVSSEEITNQVGGLLVKTGFVFMANVKPA